MYQEEVAPRLLKHVVLPLLLADDRTRVVCRPPAAHTMSTSMSKRTHQDEDRRGGEGDVHCAKSVPEHLTEHSCRGFSIPHR